ncbi:MAG: hypothetical protein WCP20_19105 [Desulfuromonadales bacterium]
MTALLNKQVPVLQEMAELEQQWLDAWPPAIESWSRFTRIRPPTLCLTSKAAKSEGLTGSFAMIRLQDQAVVINLQEVMELGISGFAHEVLAHEIGHHVLAPATLTEHTRMIARMRRALPTVEQQAPMVANLYTDLLINNRLQRSGGLRLAELYRALKGDRATGSVWTIYMRIYELLWSQQKGSLGGGATDDRMEGDAVLGARLLRSYAGDWLDGSGRFACLLLPYLMEDEKTKDLLNLWLDTRNAAAGGEPSGLTGEDPEEQGGAIHPAEDPELNGEELDEDDEGQGGNSVRPIETKDNSSRSRGQCREPFQYGEILRAAGLDLTDHEIAIRYYRERARPHLIPFPSRRTPESRDPLPEGLESWDIGHPLDAVDWLQSVLQSPHVVPGMTTVQRVWGTAEGHQPRKEPLDLDLYVDSSGSMANPQFNVSYPALAGAIVCLSALRAGARVQATLWSGSHEHICTAGFVRNEHDILAVLTGYFGGGTAFPIHILRDTYAPRGMDTRPAHIMVISDDGVSTMFDKDERGSSGWDVADNALKRARGGGTFVLNLPENWEHYAGMYGDAYGVIRKARDKHGWQIHRVASWEDLVEFARHFSRSTYGEVE